MCAFVQAKFHRTGWETTARTVTTAKRGASGISEGDKFFTVDEIVFAEKGGLLLLGARSLEGLNLTGDPRKKKLVAAGPLLAA